MMAGTGVSVGGAGMLRARRRDVSIKPNRKLDRKSSRGMIYENEELRLRTIHINAEVEQGQNDIKKLRRENEQLRREIWSLRDEYDKLEEILKSQQNREDSEEYEDRSEGDEKEDDEDVDEECSNYSGEEDEEENEDYDEEKIEILDDEKPAVNEDNQEERLENAENQKISSEKMNSSSVHRLHVEFDDLSVVDEEEEVKKEKERKDVNAGEETVLVDPTDKSVKVCMDPRSGYQYFPTGYASSVPSVSGHSYYPECPFVFPNPIEAGYSDLAPIGGSTMLSSPCPGIHDSSVGLQSNFVEIPNSPNSRQDENSLSYGSQIGWQSNIFGRNTGAFQSGIAGSILTLSGPSDEPSPASTARAASVSHGPPIDQLTSTGRLICPVENNVTNVPSLLQRRNFFLKQPNSFYRETIIPRRVTVVDPLGSDEALTQNGWNLCSDGSAGGLREIVRHAEDDKNEKDVERDNKNGSREIKEESEALHRVEDSTNAGSGTNDRPKHFFAPLPSKIQHARQDSGDKISTRISTNAPESPSATFLESYGTGRSSSSDRTNSTVISANHFRNMYLAVGTANISDKGSADIFVNGAVATFGIDQQDRYVCTNEQKSYKSSDNLVIGPRESLRGNGSSWQGSNNPLIKSISCQDLSSEPVQNSLFEIKKTFNNDKSQKLAKSDNSLENSVGGSQKPFRSQLNVTLKLPGSCNKDICQESPVTPEIPQLPSIDYRFFSNPFLKSFDPSGNSYGNYRICNPVAKPLSIEVNDDDEAVVKSTAQQNVIDYANPHGFPRRLNADENILTSTRVFNSEIENDRNRIPMISANQAIDSRIIANSKQRQEFQVTSFEQPNPRSLHAGLTAFDLDTLRRIPTTPSSNPIMPNHQKLYQNVPFVPGTGPIFCPSGQNAMRMFYDNQTIKIPVQTQTSIDGGSNHEDDQNQVTKNPSKIVDPEDPSSPSSPTTLRRKRTIRKERSNQTIEKRPLSPAAQRRRLRKQNVGGEIGKTGNKLRKFSPGTTTTTSEQMEDKTESRSSSSGQESPRKEQNRRVSSHYFNSKKRPSVTSVKTARSVSIDNTKDGFSSRTHGETLDTTNSERERTNSASSREAATRKNRKSSISSGKVPWCACWGNGCI